MGACCFTPTKRDFLWWYWLFLASIVGIPMLLAVLYVAKGRDADEQEKQRRGRRAAWIFWAGTYFMAIAVFFIVDVLLRTVYVDKAPYYFATTDASFTGWSTLAIQFFFATVAANATNSLVRKRRWFVRIPLIVLCVCFYFVFLVVLCPVALHFHYPAVNVLQFLICMIPAHYWGRFKDSPDTCHAWKAFWAFIAGATLFFLVGCSGEDLALFSKVTAAFSQFFFGPPVYGN
jgi:hypothetical protein